MSESYKKLYLKRQGKKIAGVCTGLGDYFNLDPVVVRVVFVALVFLWGFTLWLYILMWLIVPKELEEGLKKE